VNDLRTWRSNQAVHIIGQAVYVFQSNFIIYCSAGNTTVVLQTFNVLPGNTHIYHTNVNARLLFRLTDGFLNGIYSFIDVANNSSHYTFRNSFSHPENLQLPVFVLAANQSTNLGCPNI